MASKLDTVHHLVNKDLITATLYWNAATCSVCDATHCLPLPPIATRLLTYLLQHADQLVATEQLKTVGWHDEPCTTADLYKQMHELRVALQDTTPPHHCLQSRYGHGYLLHCDGFQPRAEPRVEF